MIVPISFQTVVAVVLGGAMGAVARFVISAQIQVRLGGTFPWGVLTVNLAGCLAAGLATGWLLAGGAGGWEPQGEMAPLATFLLPGLLGAFTTFSTFAADAVALASAGARKQATIYVGTSVGLGLAVAALGLAMARALSGS